MTSMMLHNPELVYISIHTDPRSVSVMQIRECVCVYLQHVQMIETVSICTDAYCVKHAYAQCMKKMQQCCKKKRIHAT